jgi:hypothetical protein
MQAPGRERQIVVVRPAERERLDLRAQGEGDPRRAATPVAGIQRVEPVGVEVVEHVADPILAGEGHPHRANVAGNGTHTLSTTTIELSYCDPSRQGRPPTLVLTSLTDGRSVIH